MDIARYLALKAQQGGLITYGELAKEFGGIARGYGNRLAGIAIHCHDQGYPLLAVIVVSAKTRMPSGDAVLYEQLGIVGREALAAEQQRCFKFDWSKTHFGEKN